MSSIYGEIAGLLTSVCWAFNSVLFTLAGKRVGAANVNRIRLWTSFPVLILLNGILFGSLFPFHIEPVRLFHLSVSGVIGFVVGDGLLFEAFLLIGPRLTMLLSLLVPVFGTGLAWIWLGETLRFPEIACILVVIGGVAWVVGDQAASGVRSTPGTTRGYYRGILYAIGGAAAQALGLMFSRKGLVGGYPALTATLVRVTAAGLVLLILVFFRGGFKASLNQMKDRVAFTQIFAGAMTGPVLGVTLSLVAIAHAPIGVASTLMSLTPVLLLPVSRWLFRERISLQAVVGTVIALAGVVLLFFL